MELYRGARSRLEEARIEGLFASARLLPVTIDIAQAAGRLAKHFQKSHGLDDLDALIAATAEHHGLKLATLNTKHFPMFPKLRRAY
jgi:predicted nucleic acid-binding protein